MDGTRDRDDSQVRSRGQIDDKGGPMHAPILRGKWMIATGVLLAGLPGVWARPAAAEDGVRVVYPTGSTDLTQTVPIVDRFTGEVIGTETTTVDARHVYEALQDPAVHTVILKATNEAGEPTPFQGSHVGYPVEEGLFAQHDLTIRGEKLRDGSVTTVRAMRLGATSADDPITVQFGPDLVLTGTFFTTNGFFAQAGGTVVGVTYRDLRPAGPDQFPAQVNPFVSHSLQPVTIRDSVFLSSQNEDTGPITEVGIAVAFTDGPPLVVEDTVVDLHSTGVHGDPYPTSAGSIGVLSLVNRQVIVEDCDITAPNPVQLLATGWPEGPSVIEDSRLTVTAPWGGGTTFIASNDIKVRDVRIDTPDGVTASYGVFGRDATNVSLSDLNLERLDVSGDAILFIGDTTGDTTKDIAY